MELLHEPGAKFEDSLLPFSLRKQGTYICNGKNFLHKYNALVEATRTMKPVQWDFNFLHFNQQATAPRLSNIDLDTLYKARALMLRDEYSYLILAYSAGSDSYNILRTFIDNGIKLDEIWVDMPLNMVEQAGYIPNMSKDSGNIVSEWYYAIKPDLDKLRITNPEIKINISDPTINPSEEDFEDTVSVSGTITVYTSLKRYRYIRDYVMGISQKKTVALVTGQDKPIPAKHTRDGVTYYGFVLADYSTYLKSDESSNGKFLVEYFYWSPNFPVIAVEQARRVWDYLFVNQQEANEKFEHFSDVNRRSFREKNFDTIVKKVCYSNWDFDRHQVEKTGQLTNGQFSSFLDLHKSERFIQSWRSNRDRSISALNANHFVPTLDGSKKELKSFTNFHTLGQFNI